MKTGTIRVFAKKDEEVRLGRGVLQNNAPIPTAQLFCVIAR